MVPCGSGEFYSVSKLSMSSSGIFASKQHSSRLMISVLGCSISLNMSFRVKNTPSGLGLFRGLCLAAQRLLGAVGSDMLFRGLLGYRDCNEVCLLA